MRSIAPLTCLALMLAATPAFATTWFSGSATPIASPSELGRDAILQQSAIAHVRGRSSELGLGGVELGAARVVRTAAGARIVRLEQRVDGIPVLSGGAIVQIANDGSVSRIGVDVATDLDVDTVPTIDDAEAKADLEAALGRAVPTPKTSKLVIGRFGGGTLLWQLDVRDTAAGTRYWVDAHTGAVAATRPLATDALGSVYLLNSVDSPDPTDEELALLDTTAAPIHLNGWANDLLTVTNYVSGSSMTNYTVEQTLVPSSGQDFLYPPPADVSDVTDAFAQVNLYYHLTAIRTLYQNLGATVDDASWKITAIANATEDGQPLDNAFFTQMGIDGPFASPNLIVIGQGTLNDFAYDSDVFKHEFGHYVTYNQIGYNLGQTNFDDLGLSPFSGAIDEGIADYFACSDNDDPQVGEATLFPLGAGRDLTDISKHCPDDMDSEVHDDGEIIGSVSWSIRTAVGKDLGDRVVWGAISTLLPGGNFDDFAQGILSTTDDMVTAGDLTAQDKTTIQGILTDCGLDQCGRIIPIGVGQHRKGTLIGLDILGQFLGADCATAQQFGVSLPSLFHFSWTPSADDVGLKVSLDMTPSGPGDIDYTVFGRANQPVHFGSDPTSGLPLVDQSDYSVVAPDVNSELVIDASSNPPFDPTATYDFVVVTRSCPILGMDISVASYTPPPPGDGGGGAGTGGSPTSDGGNGGAGGAGGGGADGNPDDGCGCKLAGTTNGNGSPAALFGIAALGLIAARRRNRR